MPVIEPETKPVKKVIFSARVGPNVVETRRAYCDFLNGSSQHHVVQQLLQHSFNSDSEFQAWLRQHGTTRRKERTTSKAS